jgi:tetratricopeptide (TPR) repeat protein
MYVETPLTDALRIMGDCEAQLKQFRERLAALPQATEAAKQEVASAKTQLEQILGQGFKAREAAKLLQEAEGALLRALDQTTKPGVAVLLVDVAAREAKNARTNALKQQEAKTALDQRLTRCGERIEQVKQAIINGAQAFGRMSEKYSLDAIEPIKGNGSRAMAIVTQCMSMCKEASHLASMEMQNWEGADSIIDQMQDDNRGDDDQSGRLAQAESLMRSLFELEKSLDQAAQDAPRTIMSTVEDIRRAEEYIAECRRTTTISSEVDNMLLEAKRILSLATSEIGKSKPDPLEVVKFARQAHDILDEVLENARTEHEQFLRLKEKVEGKLRSARARVSKAREYVADHRSNVKRKATICLSEAEHSLREAELQALHANDVSTFNTVIVMLDQADDLGKRSYKEASLNVEAAAPVYVGSSYESSSSYSSRSSDSYSGGSSSDFGSSVSSFSDSGGSSSSW